MYSGLHRVHGGFFPEIKIILYDLIFSIAAPVRVCFAVRVCYAVRVVRTEETAELSMRWRTFSETCQAQLFRANNIYPGARTRFGETASTNPISKTGEATVTRIRQ